MCAAVVKKPVGRYDFFIPEVVQAHAASSPRHPKTIHCTGDGVFLEAGKAFSRRSPFRRELL
jgi:hypothetical protein